MLLLFFHLGWVALSVREYLLFLDDFFCRLATFFNWFGGLGYCLLVLEPGQALVILLSICEEKVKLLMSVLLETD